LQRSWRLFADEENNLSSAVKDVDPDPELLRLLHRTIAKVTSDLEGLRFNTAIATLMELVNALTSKDVRSWSVLETFVKLVAPFAPHLGEELWHLLGHKTTIAYESWPEHDPIHLVVDEVELPVSVNGKVRDKIRIAPDEADARVRELALESPAVRKHLQDKEPRKVIYVKGRMVNVVV
jgi:leucyl-tRNA synthetase